LSSMARVEEVFHAASALPRPQRAEFLDRACGGDHALREQVLRLLNAEDTSTSGVLAWSPAQAEPEPTSIGPYTILGVLGEGGMGRVYEAQQASPKRSVALKVIRAGFGTSEGLHRFAREAEMLAQLKHAGIAQVYESGVAPDNHGTPRRFLAMELVRGEPLLHHAESAKLSLDERVELLARVADAVQHAHQRGVIHRDLKSANILIEPVAGDRIGQPKVLDFGVARLQEGADGARSMVTEAGRIIGTLAYMSPEQITGDARQVDTRSDVYALGVLGYQLLSGKPPLPIGESSLADAARLIRDVEPTRLGSVARGCRGDLETIIAKAMEKDRERRYSGAGELAADLRRHLRDEAITARPPTTMYQLSRFARRNRAVVAAATLALVALVVGLVVSTVQYSRASRAAARSDHVAKLLKGMIGGINPRVAQARDTVLLKEIVDTTASTLGTTLESEPGVESELRGVLGEVYYSIGEFDKAIEQNRIAIERGEAAYGRQSAAVAAGLMRLSQALNNARQQDQAISTAEECVAITRALKGSEHADTGEALAVLGAAQRRKDLPRSLHSFAEGAAICERAAGPDALVVGRVLEQYGGALVEAGRSDDAEKALRRAYDIRSKLQGAESMETLSVAGLLGDTYVLKQRFAEAEPFCRVYAEKMAKLLPAGHPSVPLAWASLAQTLAKQGKLGAAIALYRAQIEPLTASQGADDLNVGTLHGNLGNVLVDAGELDEAERRFREALRVYTVAEGTNVLRRPFALLGLANVQQARGDLAGAEKFAREAYDTAQRVLPPKHAGIGRTAVALSAALCELAWAALPERASDAGTLAAESAKYAEVALALFVQTTGEDHFNTWQARARVVMAHAAGACAAGRSGTAAGERAPSSPAGNEELSRLREAFRSRPTLGAFPVRELVQFELARAASRMDTCSSPPQPDRAREAEREAAELAALIAQRRAAELVQ
jgi:eukaryotic-like serine/threonine-protein kinase